MTAAFPTTDEPRVALKVLAYLAQNPDAQDTLEGIVEWWLPECNIGVEVARVKRALSILVSDGFVVESKGWDLRSHYQVNRAELETIRDLLEPGRPELE
ncbi:MAG: hypothetical protein ACE5JX_00150 [Acidobacteriota bacterium]